MFSERNWFFFKTHISVTKHKWLCIIKTFVVQFLKSIKFNINDFNYYFFREIWMNLLVNLFSPVRNLPRTCIYTIPEKNGGYRGSRSPRI